MYRNDVKVITCNEYKDCEVCKEWNKKGQRWKVFEFCPFHCSICFFAGHCEDFRIKGNVLLCISCVKKYINYDYVQKRQYT